MQKNKILKYDGRSSVAAGTKRDYRGNALQFDLRYIADGYFTSADEVSSSAFQELKKQE
jgi:hypothetical protein